MKQADVDEIWEKLRPIDTGELCYLQLYGAISKVVGVDNDVPTDQPASLDKTGRTLIPVDQLIAAINQLATRPRGHDIERDAGIVGSIADALVSGEPMGPTWLKGVSERLAGVAKSMLDYQ
jgi:hypothetical protein